MSTRGKEDPKVKEWISKFDKEFGRRKKEWESLSKSPASRSHYTLGYWIDALTSIYETTGDKEYLRRALTYVRSVISSAVPAPQFKDGYLGWMSKPTDKDREAPLYESCMWRYVARILRMIKETPALNDDPDFRNFSQEVLPFIEKQIWEKWYNRGKDHKYIYRNRTHIASHWAFIALNMLKVSTDETKRSQYQEVLSKINDDLRKNLHPAQNDPDSYFWHATWDTDDTEPQVQDVSHGNHVMSYATESFEQGVFWNEPDITKFGNTLKKIVWDSSKCDFFDFVDGTYGEVDGWEHPGRRQSDGWVKLGRFDRKIQQIYEKYLQDNPKAADFAEQLPQLFANMALNEKKLSEKKGQEEEQEQEQEQEQESPTFIRLTSPVGGETLLAGKRHIITWSDKKTEVPVNIEYSTNKGRSWEIIDTNIPNDGARSWKIPNIKSRKCLLRIRRSDGSAEDVSRDVFRILG